MYNNVSLYINNRDRIQCVLVHFNHLPLHSCGKAKTSLDHYRHYMMHSKTCRLYLICGVQRIH